MHINLDESICEVDFANNANLCHALENILAAGFEGSHFISGNITTLRTISKLEQLGSRSKAYLTKQIKWLPQQGEIFSKLAPSLVIEGHLADPYKNNITNCWHVPLLRFSNLESVVPSLLISENQNDCRLYIHAARHYCLSNNLNTINMAFTTQGGGGSTTYTEVRNRVALGKGLCICIVDSDKFCPNSNIGETARKCFEEVNGDEWWLSLIVTSRRELENHIPSKFIESCLTIEEVTVYLGVMEQITNIDPNLNHFFDFKKGLSLEWVFDQPEGSPTRVYWNNVLEHITLDNACHQNCIVNNACINKPIQLACHSHKLIDGVSNNILSRVLDWLDHQSEHSAHKLITNSNEDSWLALGEQVFKYCFGSPKLRI